MKMPERTFGVELEIINLSEAQCYRALREAGIPVRDPNRWDDYNSGGRKWDIKGDCSISSPNGRSAEVVSPVLSGVKGLREVRKVCRVLVEAGAWVNSSCGLHVHVGATKGHHKLTAHEVATLIMRYAKYEPMIDRFVHPSRRENRGEFCQSMIEDAKELTNGGKGGLEQKLQYFRNSLAQCRHQIWDYNTSRYVTRTADTCDHCWSYRTEIENTTAELANHPGTFNDVNDITDIVCERYSKVNMQAWHDHGTIEFRQHNGALDPKTVTNWIRFVVTFVERSRMVAAKKGRDTSPLTGLPSDVRKFYKARASQHTRSFDAWA